MADDEHPGHWDGFSIYADVSQDIHSAVTDAIDSYSVIVSRHSEGAKVKPAEAAQHKANILGAANRLLTELEREVNRGSKYSDDLDAILDDWTDAGDEDGYIKEFHAAQLTSGYPGWMYDFVRQIHEVAWLLGYLKAGRIEEDKPNTPSSNGREMVEDIMEITNGTSTSDA